MPHPTRTGSIVLLLIFHYAVVSGIRTTNLPLTSTSTDGIRDALLLGCPNESHEYIRSDIVTAMLDKRLPTDRPSIPRDHFDHMFYSSQKPEYDAYERAVERLISSDGDITRADTPMPCGSYADVEAEVDLKQVFGHCKVCVSDRRDWNATAQGSSSQCSSIDFNKIHNCSIRLCCNDNTSCGL
jgi:hypothetical protein